MGGVSITSSTNELYILNKVSNIVYMPRRFTRKRTFRRRKPRVGKGIRRYVKKAIDRNVEDKFYTGIYTGFTGYNGINTTWQETNLLQLSQGSGPSNRIGNLIRVKSIYIKLLLTSLTGYPCQIRAITTIATSTIPLSFASPAVTLDNLYSSHYNSLGYLTKKLSDKLYVLDDTQNKKQVWLTVKKRFKRPQYIRYGGTAASTCNKYFTVSLLSDKGTNIPYIAAGRFIIIYEDA